MALAAAADAGLTFTMIVQAVESLQTEILLFVLAIGFHVMLTGKILPSRRVKGGERKVCKPSGAEEAERLDVPKAQDAGRSSKCLFSAGKALQLNLEPLLRDGASMADMESVLDKLPTQKQTDAFVGCLRSVGCKNADVVLLKAMVNVARKGGRELAMPLAECMLQAHLEAGRLVEFDEVMACVDTSCSTSSSIGLLALRAAVQRSDAAGALSHLNAVRSLWKVKTASSAPQSLLQQIAELAAESANEQLLATVLELLPATPTARAAAAVLRASAATASTQRRKEEAMIRVYRSHLSAVDFSADSATERMLIELALRLGGDDMLASLLSRSLRGNRQASYLKNLRLEDALRVFEACPEKASCHYNAIIDNCLKCKELADAERFMSCAVRNGDADIVTYNTMVKAQLQMGSRHSARKLLVAMRNAGLKPNIVTYNEFLDDAVSRDGEDVWAIVEEIKAAGLRPSHITCSILLKNVHAKANTRNVDMERIMELVDNVDDDTDEVLLSSVVEACVRTNRNELLIRYLRHQQSRTKDGITAKNAHTYGSIIRAYGVVHDLEGVWNAWHEMKKRHVKITSITLGCMVEALASNADPDAALSLIEEMRADPDTFNLVNAVTYCSLVKGFSQQKRFDRVWEIYTDMLSQAHLELSIVTFNTLVDACARSREMNRIPAILDDMVGRGIEPNLITYSAIIKGYCQDNKLEQAFELLESMRKTTNFTPDEVMYNSLVDGCARQGLYARGMRLLDEMQENGVAPTNYTLSVLVKLAGRARKVDRAFELCDEISSKFRFRLNIHVFNNLAQACISNKELERAMAVLERMMRERVRPDLRTYRLLAFGCIEHCDFEGAAALIRCACGLGVPEKQLPRLAGVRADALRPTAGAPLEVATEVVEAILARNKGLAAELVQDLSARCSGFRLNSKLRLQLTTRALAASQSRR